MEHKLNYYGVENKFATPPPVLCSILLSYIDIIRQSEERQNIFS